MPTNPGFQLARRSGPLLILLGVWSIAGCSIPTAPPVELTSWQPTPDETIQLTHLVRVRVSPDRPLPTHLVQQLCPEYALVVVSRSADWNELCRRVSLPPQFRSLDLSHGRVVGILAEVGENAGGQWPIRLVSVRSNAGEALLEAAFLPGLYYPLRIAGYLELAQIRGTARVTTVRVDSRVFTIRSVRQFN